jgi:hypothetical protein
LIRVMGDFILVSPVEQQLPPKKYRSRILRK